MNKIYYVGTYNYYDDKKERSKSVLKKILACLKFVDTAIKKITRYKIAI